MDDNKVFTFCFVAAAIAIAIIAASYNYRQMKEVEKAMEMGYEQVFEFGGGTMWKLKK